MSQQHSTNDSASEAIAMATQRLRSSAPEPLPDWSAAREQWKFLWPSYFIGFGCVFGLLSVYVTVVMATQRRRLSVNSYMLAVGVLLVVLGLLRFLYLIIDPHESINTLHKIFCRLAYSLPYPCLLSAFAFLQSYLVQTIKFHRENKRSRNSNVLLSFIVFYFVLVTSVNVVVAYSNRLRLLMTSYYFVDVTWTVVLCFGFVYNNFKVVEFAAEAKRTVRQIYAYRQRKKSLHSLNTVDGSGAGISVLSRDLSLQSTILSQSLVEDAGKRELFSKMCRENSVAANNGCTTTALQKRILENGSVLTTATATTGVSCENSSTDEDDVIIRKEAERLSRAKRRLRRQRRRKYRLALMADGDICGLAYGLLLHIYFLFLLMLMQT